MINGLSAVYVLLASPHSLTVAGSELGAVLCPSHFFPSPMIADFKKMNHSTFFLPSSVVPHCCPRSPCSGLIWHSFMVSVRDHDL